MTGELFRSRSHSSYKCIQAALERSARGISCDCLSAVPYVKAQPESFLSLTHTHLVQVPKHEFRHRPLSIWSLEWCLITATFSTFYCFRLLVIFRSGLKTVFVVFLFCSPTLIWSSSRQWPFFLSTYSALWIFNFIIQTHGKINKLCH